MFDRTSNLNFHLSPSKIFSNKMYLHTVLIFILVNCALSPLSVQAKWGQPKKECLGGHCHQQCHLTPHAMEGPFYVPLQPVRSDITEDKEGIPLKLELNFKDYHNKCSPVRDAEVHIWQPDALGVYSAYLGYYPLGKPGSKQITGEHAEPTDKSTFLRGIQKTDEDGKVTFLSIYPGWYLHRALHIHFKVIMNGEDIYNGEVYFLEEISDLVAKVKPYSGQKEKRALNEDDWLFMRLDGFRSVAKVNGDVNDGFTASLDVVIEPPFNDNDII